MMPTREDKDAPQLKRPKRAAHGEKRQTFTFRLSNEIRDRARAAADAAGRSMSEELELRIEKSFDQESYIETTFRKMLGGPITQKIVLGISHLINLIEVKEKKSIGSDNVTAIIAYVAMHELIEKMYNYPNVPENVRDAIKKEIIGAVSRADELMASPDVLMVMKNRDLADLFSRIARGENINFENYEDLKLIIEQEIKTN